MVSQVAQARNGKSQTVNCFGKAVTKTGAGFRAVAPDLRGRRAGRRICPCVTLFLVINHPQEKSPAWVFIANRQKSAQSFSISVLASGAFPALPAYAATVTLDNGDQITGELLQLGNDTPSFKSSLFGDVNISRNHASMPVSDDGHANRGGTVRLIRRTGTRQERNNEWRICFKKRRSRILPS